jgi:hypothetical protein
MQNCLRELCYNDGNKAWKNWFEDIAPNPYKEASLERTSSGEDQFSGDIIETPLYPGGKNQLHINCLELLAIIIATNIGDHKLKGKKYLFPVIMRHQCTLLIQVLLRIATKVNLSFTYLGILLNIVCPLPTIFEGKAWRSQFNKGLTNNLPW